MIRAAVAALILAGLTAAPSYAAPTSTCGDTVQHVRRCSHVQVYGHRGQQNQSENTMAALRHDYEAGVGFETDTWQTTDGVSVIFHDVYLARMIDPASMPYGVTARTRIDSLTWGQVSQLRTKGTGQPVPTLKAWIRYAGRHGVPGMVEVKYGQINAPQAWAYVDHWNAAGVSFYQTPKCGHGRVLHPELSDYPLRVGAKMLGGCQRSPVELAEAGYGYIITGADQITPAYVTEAHRYGLEVGNFDSGHVEVWARIVDAAADYITAPHPVRAQHWLAGA